MWLTSCPLQEDKIVTRFFGDCSPGVKDPLVFPLGTQTRQATLCESKPYYAWQATIATADLLGAGTNGEVSLSWRCGAFQATAGVVVLTPNTYVRQECGLFNNCFVRGQTNRFNIKFDMGRWSPSGPVTPAQFPLPACTTPGVQPVLTLAFKGNGLHDGESDHVGAAHAARPLR